MNDLQDHNDRLKIALLEMEELLHETVMVHVRSGEVRQNILKDMKNIRKGAQI